MKQPLISKKRVKLCFLTQVCLTEWKSYVQRNISKGHFLDKISNKFHVSHSRTRGWLLWICSENYRVTVIRNWDFLMGLVKVGCSWSTLPSELYCLLCSLGNLCIKAHWSLEALSPELYSAKLIKVYYTCSRLLAPSHAHSIYHRLSTYRESRVEGSSCFNKRPFHTSCDIWGCYSCADGVSSCLRHDTGSIYTTELSKEEAAFIFRFVSFWGGSEEVPLKC